MHVFNLPLTSVIMIEGKFLIRLGVIQAVAFLKLLSLFNESFKSIVWNDK